MKTYRNPIGMLAVFTLVILFAIPQSLNAHCDSMNGPVVKDAKLALAKNDVTQVLKWVKPEYEAQVRSAFGRTLSVRSQSAAAKELADLYFFETLVRLHRAGEGEPYTGLKPADTAIDPGIEAADAALESSAVDPLISDVTRHVAGEIRQRFARTIETKQHSAESVQAGREYVEAYVSFIHYVEQLHNGSAEPAESGHRHQAD